VFSSRSRGYYLPKSVELAKRRDRWRAAQQFFLVAAALVGVVLSVAPEVSHSVAPWIAVLTTIAGVLAAEIEASRYDLLVTSYRATAYRLQELYAEWADVVQRGVKPWTQVRDDFVNRAEEAISVENLAWMAEWARPTK